MNIQSKPKNEAVVISPSVVFNISTKIVVKAYDITVNDWLSDLGAFLKRKAFRWALLQTGLLIGCGRLFKKKKKIRVSQVYFFQKSRNFFQNPFHNWSHKSIFLLFKLAPNFNWAVKQPWALLWNISPKDWVLNRSFTVYKRYLVTYETIV